MAEHRRVTPTMALQSAMQRAITVVDRAEARVVRSGNGTGNGAWQWKPSDQEK